MTTHFCEFFAFEDLDVFDAFNVVQTHVRTHFAQAAQRVALRLNIFSYKEFNQFNSFIQFIHLTVKRTLVSSCERTRRTRARIERKCCERSDLRRRAARSRVLHEHVSHRGNAQQTRGILPRSAAVVTRDVTHPPARSQSELRAVARRAPARTRVKRAECRSDARSLLCPTQCLQRQHRPSWRAPLDSEGRSLDDS